MVAPSMQQSDFTLPAPGPQEFSTVLTELKAENVQLLEVRRCYLRMFDVVYSELERAFIAEAEIRKENDHLREHLLSLLGATPGPKPSKEQQFNHALHEEGAQRSEEFLIYHADKKHMSSSEGFNDKDLLPAFRFSNSQTPKGAKVFDLKTSITGCESVLSTPKIPPTEPAFHMNGPVASWDAETSGPSNPNVAFHSCRTSKFCGHRIPAQAVVIANKPQNLEPHAVEVPIQGHVPSPANTLPMLAEILPNLALASGRVLSPTGLQQATSSNPIMCLPSNLSNGSSLPAVSTHSSRVLEPMIDSNFTGGECLVTSQNVQPNSATLELNSTPSSAGVDYRLIPPGVTTLVIRNVPARYTKELLMQEWPVDGTYDFLYLPFSLKQKRTAGFAFVNFTSHEAAVHFYSQWHSKSLRDHGTAKQLKIGVAEIQGLEENLRHVAASVTRVKNPKYLPSVFSGIDEVPLVGLLGQITISGVGGLTGESSSR